MTLNEYQKQAMTTCTESSMNDTYLMFGLMAEVGELADKVAKAKRKEIITIESNDIYLDLKADIGDYEDFQSHFIKELGDILWFVALISKKAGFTLDSVAQLNLDKLADRAKRGKIIGEGDDR